MSPKDDPIMALVNSVEPFIKMYADRYARAYTVDADDLKQMARLRACRSAVTYDASHGVPFLHYCAEGLKAAMRREAMKFTSPLRRPAATFHTEPVYRVPLDVKSDQEALRRSADLIRYHNGAHSQATGKNSDDPTLDLFKWDDTTPRDHVDAKLAREALTEAIARLTDLQQRVITAYFIEQKPMREIGAEMGTSHQYVQQLITGALTRLRVHPAIKRLMGTMPQRYSLNKPNSEDARPRS